MNLTLAFLGQQEMIVIFLIVLLLFGAKKIPELARGVGKGMGEFKKAKEDSEHEIKAGEVQGQKDWEESTSKPDPGPAPAPPAEADSTESQAPEEETDSSEEKQD